MDNYTAEIEQDCKEFRAYFDYLCTQPQKDAGNLWIQLTDKFNAFEKKLLSLSSQSQQQDKVKEPTDQEMADDLFRIIYDCLKPHNTGNIGGVPNLQAKLIKYYRSLLTVKEGDKEKK
jgi:hypothetical protein